MDKEQLEKRLKTLMEMRENHLQDVEELAFVIAGLEEQIKLFG